MPMKRLPRKIMLCWVDSKQPVGCPSFTYGRGLNKSQHKAGIDINKWHALAQNRQDWHLWSDCILCVYIIYSNLFLAL